LEWNEEIFFGNGTKRIDRVDNQLLFNHSNSTPKTVVLKQVLNWQTKHVGSSRMNRVDDDTFTIHVVVDVEPDNFAKK
jgi:hypothetical protein